jgi:putative tryptophan/tyrosine transport system substrate-binding protein
MRRRQFIALVGCATAWPFVAHAQQTGMPVIGFLSSRSPAESEAVVSAFREGLREAGYIAGQNVAIDYRWAEGHYGQLPALAAELIGLRVAVIFAAGGPPSALAAKAATSSIPIVFSAVPDPVRLGLVASLGRPGGNVTGMSTFTADLGAKEVELLKELLPAIKTLVYLVNPTNPSGRLEAEAAVTAGGAAGIQVQVLNASTESELESVFESWPNPDALIVAGEPFFDSRRSRIVALVAKRGTPAMYSWRENVALGGLISYGSSLTDSYRKAGAYAGRILKGERPTDLPVMQPTKFELTINLKTAKTLGISISPTLLARADEVVE